MLKITRISIVFLILLSNLWAILTLIVEQTGPERALLLGAESETQNTALIVYDPDPFYSFDEQVCYGFSKGLAENGWRVQMATVAAAEKLEQSFDLIAFCANTYNWTPDVTIKRFIKNCSDLEQKPVVAITIGGGSTRTARRILENLLKDKSAKIIASEEYWLWRPNDESRMDESNVIVAIDQATQLGTAVGEKLSR